MSLMVGPLPLRENDGAQVTTEPTGAAFVPLRK